MWLLVCMSDDCANATHRIRLAWLFDRRTEERARETERDMQREEEDDQEKMRTMIITQMIMIVFVNNFTNSLFSLLSFFKLLFDLDTMSYLKLPVMKYFFLFIFSSFSISFSHSLSMGVLVWILWLRASWLTTKAVLYVPIGCTKHFQIEDPMTYHVQIVPDLHSNVELTAFISGVCLCTKQVLSQSDQLE